MPGKTPLVGWIKGYMVPELLEIEVLVYPFVGRISFLCVFNIGLRGLDGAEAS